MRVGILVQARMSSSRLPGKVLIPILKKPLLGYLLERLQRVDASDALVVATSTDQSDDPIVAYCDSIGVTGFRGDLNDVLKRFCDAATHYSLDAVVRICGDSPLIDPELVSRGIQLYRKAPIDCLTTLLGSEEGRGLPRGQEIEIISRSALERANALAKAADEREHVTPFLYRHPELFRLESYRGPYPDLESQRWVVDEQADLDFVRALIEGIYPQSPEMSFEEIVDYLAHHPELLAINRHVVQYRIPSQ